MNDIDDAERHATVLLRKTMLLLVMKVSRCGKSTVSQELWRLLGWPFKEGDNLIARRISKRCDPANP